MAENLNYDIDGSICYDNEESKCDNGYGRFYNSDMIFNKARCTNSTSEGICPENWCVPGRADYGNVASKTDVNFLDENSWNVEVVINEDLPRFDIIATGSYWKRSSDGVEFFSYRGVETNLAYWDGTRGGTSSYNSVFSDPYYGGFHYGFISKENAYPVKCIFDKSSLEN